MAPFWKNLNLGFLSSLGGGSKDFVAFDIGASSIKMVEASAEKGSYRLLSLGVLPIPPNTVQNNMIVDTKPVADVIRNLIQENKVKAKQVIAAVPGRAVIMKKVQMPKQDKAELENNIEFEAQNVIPESLDNVNLDYQVLAQSADGNRMEVLLVAVKKEIVNSYADTIAEAGLNLAVMDVDYFALENMYETNYAADAAAGVVGLIHVGSQNTSISLLQNGQSIFTGDLSTGGAYFSESLARQLNISAAEAENYKITGAMEGHTGTELDAALRPTAEELAEEIRRTVSLYGAVPSDDGDGLKTIYLSGGGAKLVGLRSLLEQSMAVPVRMTEPFLSFAVHKNIDREYLAEAAPYFAVASGLSIRRPGDK